jgi:hypothetical protein
VPDDQVPLMSSPPRQQQQQQQHQQQKNDKVMQLRQELQAALQQIKEQNIQLAVKAEQKRLLALENDELRSRQERGEHLGTQAQMLQDDLDSLLPCDTAAAPSQQGGAPDVPTAFTVRGCRKQTQVQDIMCKCPASASTCIITICTGLATGTLHRTCRAPWHGL